MQAVVVAAPGAEPTWTEFADPVPREGEQIVDLVAAGVHHVVRSIASGRHYGSSEDYPLVPGVDCVARTADGTLVYTGLVREPWGTMAERLAVPMTIPLPPGADPAVIAGGTNPGMSGWLPLRARAAEWDLDTVVVLGATGASGRIATRAALLLGAEQVIAVGRDHAALAALAEDRVRPVDLTAGEQGLTSALAGADVSLVLDYLWGPVAELAFAALSRRGLTEDIGDCRYVQIGSVAGPTTTLPAALLRSRRITLVGNGAGSASTRDLRSELPRLLEHLASGALPVDVTAHPISEVASVWSEPSRSRLVLTL